ncbi:MAG TPA: hypothetical protein VLO13_02925 [Halomonas sp.]|nr:hypothetical protein [Halomonas sp.]
MTKLLNEVVERMEEEELLGVLVTMAINLEARIERLEMKHAAMERCIQDLTDLKSLLEFYVDIQKMKAEEKVNGNNRRP